MYATSFREVFVTALLVFCTAQQIASAARSTNTYYDGYSETTRAAGSSYDGVCGINLQGKTERPYPNVTTWSSSSSSPSSSMRRKTSEEINFATADRDDFRAQFSAIDFTWDVVRAVQDANTGSGGSLALISAKEMPSLAGEGVAISSVFFEPCGVLHAHINPRGTEMIYVTQGKALEVGVVDNRLGSRHVITTLSEGQMTFVPRGYLHYIVNRDCSNASSIAFYNSDDPGVWTAPWSFFDLKPDVVASLLDVDETLVRAIRQNQPDVNPVRGSQECMKRCGLSAGGGGETNKYNYNYKEEN